MRWVLDLLPRFVGGYERLLIKIGSEGFHKPGYYFSTLFCAPLGCALWRKEVDRWWKRVPCRVGAYVLLIAGIFFFVRGCWLFTLLTLLGRPIRRVFLLLGLDQSRAFPPQPESLSFALTRLDRAVLAFMGVILLVMFVNRSQLMPHDDSDHNYHMAVARRILETGAVPEWDDWEYAPAGRPHLYPPALHVMIAFFAGSPDNVEEGFETLQVVVYPIAIFLTWWFARWMFGARIGFLAVLVFSMDMMCSMVMISVLPSAMITGAMPLIFMCFLTKRSKATIALLVFALYTHMGVSALIMLGLFIFAARYKGYYAFCKHVLMWSFIFYLPWFFRLLENINWFGMPSSRIFAEGGRSVESMIAGAVMGFLSLQMINPLFLVLGLVGLRRLRRPGTRFLRNILAGFLPMLILYGGRFWMHTGPIWAIFTGSLLLRCLPAEPTRRRIAVLILCTLIPLPIVTVGMPSQHGVKIVPGVGGAVFAAAYVLTPYELDTDFDRLARFVREHTAKREIVHVDPDKDYLGDRIVTATGRRVDVGGWSSEVRDQQMVKTVADYGAADTNCLFVYEHREVPAELGCDRVERIGRFNVGIRGKNVPIAEQTHPPEPGDREDVEEKDTPTSEAAGSPDGPGT